MTAARFFSTILIRQKPLIQGPIGVWEATKITNMKPPQEFIEEKIERFFKINGLFITSSPDNFYAIGAWLCTALSEAIAFGFRMGMDKKFQEDAAQKAYDRGAATMKKSILDALPEELEKGAPRGNMDESSVGFNQCLQEIRSTIESI